MIAQSYKRIYTDSCDIKYQSIISQYDSGHYQIVDIMAQDYINNCKGNNDKVVDILNLAKLNANRNAFNYEEMKYFQKKIDSVRVTQENMILNYPWRVGLLVSLNMTSIGQPGMGFGATIGYHDIDTSGSGIGIDISFKYHIDRFTFNLIENQGEKNNYKPDGYIYKAEGNTKLFSFDFTGSINNEPISYADGRSLKRLQKFGYGGFLGLEVNFVVPDQYLKKLYQETDYSDSIYNQTNTSRDVTLNFTAQSRSDFEKSHFFENAIICSGIFGINLYYRLNSRFMITVKPNFDIALTKFKITDVGYKKEFNQLNIIASFNYLFMK